VFSSVLASILLMMNYNKSLVDQFTFIILLATLNTLVPYTFCTMSEAMIYIKDPARFSGKRLGGGLVISILAFVYSLWAIAGAGQEIVYWGFIFLMAGVPVYVWIRWQSGRLSDQCSGDSSPRWGCQAKHSYLAAGLFRALAPAAFRSQIRCRRLVRVAAAW
jgi:APA family basic amino acid/polyamine antiporter